MIFHTQEGVSLHVCPQIPVLFLEETKYHRQDTFVRLISLFVFKNSINLFDCTISIYHKMLSKNFRTKRILLSIIPSHQRSYAKNLRRTMNDREIVTRSMKKFGVNKGEMCILL